MSSLLLGCDPEGPERCGPSTAVVTRVIDGDTVELEDGLRLRYLMVDTPEVSGTPECFGAAAQQYNTELVEGLEVRLTYDVECEDRFGRLLAYVSVDGREVNRLLVKRGFACVLHIPPNGADRLEEFESLEQTAEAGGRGLWGECEENPCN